MAIVFLQAFAWMKMQQTEQEKHILKVKETLKRYYRQDLIHGWKLVKKTMKISYPLNNTLNIVKKTNTNLKQTEQDFKTLQKLNEMKKTYFFENISATSDKKLYGIFKDGQELGIATAFELQDAKDIVTALNACYSRQNEKDRATYDGNIWDCYTLFIDGKPEILLQCGEDEAANYTCYVNAKLDIEETPLSFDQWQELETL